MNITGIALWPFDNEHALYLSKIRCICSSLAMLKLTMKCMVQTTYNGYECAKFKTSNKQRTERARQTNEGQEDEDDREAWNSHINYLLEHVYKSITCASFFRYIGSPLFHFHVPV